MRENTTLSLAPVLQNFLYWYFFLWSQIVEVLKNSSFLVRDLYSNRAMFQINSVQGFLRNQYYAVDVYIKPIQ